MITKFKIFEALNEGKPEIGDYVICRYNYTSPSKLHKIFKLHKQEIDSFLKNNIGIIKDYDMSFEIEFEGSISDIYISTLEKIGFFNYKRSRITKPDLYFKTFQDDEIWCWSKNKKDLEELLQLKKYNV